MRGLPPQSLLNPAGTGKPSVILRPWHQSASEISLREFTNTAFNQHHGIQSVERFGEADADGDGIARELTQADVTAVVLFIATLPVLARDTRCSSIPAGRSAALRRSPRWAAR